ncbi:MAG: peptidylprolyl isomerase [Sphingobacteriaceae bacterium]|nr:peptidylprolyl isomerase [Sphingobacteriaceae bacterium]
MKKTLIACLVFLSLNALAAKPKHQFVRISTEKGTCVVLLYNQTPLHRDNFVKITQEGKLSETLFHRVIKGFMIQGGDPDSKTAKPGQALGDGDWGYTVPAEFRDSLFHKKGVIAAARDDNPSKASSACQFYLAQGKVFTDEQLDLLEQNRLKRKIPTWQREVYKTLGGIPHLDQNYTVFGEVVQGIEMIDTIAAVKTGAADRPVEDVRMTVTVLKKKEAKKLEKSLGLASKP